MKILLRLWSFSWYVCLTLSFRTSLLTSFCTSFIRHFHYLLHAFTSLLLKSLSCLNLIRINKDPNSLIRLIFQCLTIHLYYQEFLDVWIQVCNMFQSQQIISKTLIFVWLFWTNHQNLDDNAFRNLKLLYCTKSQDQMISLTIFANICTNHILCMDWIRVRNSQCLIWLLWVWSNFLLNTIDMFIIRAFLHCLGFSLKLMLFFSLFIVDWIHTFCELISWNCHFWSSINPWNSSRKL